jgi:hypothetical protein
VTRYIEFELERAATSSARITITEPLSVARPTFFRQGYFDTQLLTKNQSINYDQELNGVE